MKSSALIHRYLAVIQIVNPTSGPHFRVPKMGFVLMLIYCRNNYHVMGNPHFNKKILTSCIIISILLIGMSYSSHYIVQSISAKSSSYDKVSSSSKDSSSSSSKDSSSSSSKDSSSSSSKDSSSSKSNTSSIALNALELKNETYRWQNTSKAINPTLHLIANTDYLIKIKNPTDTKHELIITSNGTELAKSNEMKPGSNGKLNLPVNSTGTLEYHCEYHPDTMKGTIEISSK
jgi:plastocyanin